jgi:hypothetical protein
MNFIHQELAKGKWFTLTLMEQLANVGSEVERTIRASKNNNPVQKEKAFYRALDLLDLTIIDPRWRTRLKEITRAREVLCDLFYGDNIYNTSFDSISKYFLYFGIAARLNR